MSNPDLSSGDTSPLKGPAPKAQPEDISDIDKVDDAMPLTSPGDQPVQFIPANNGDAKVDIPEGGTAPVFVGLGKDELMKYANDPFWVRLRWFLFILFWVLWVAMLAGAIVIIVLAPKCAEQKSHPDAYYEIDLKNFAKDGQFADLGARVQYLSDLGMTSVIISDVLKKDDNGETLDFKDVDEEFGTLADFSDAIKKLKTAGLRVLLTLVPNHSGTNHEWFNDTENKDDYYIRKLNSELFGTTWKQVDQRNVDAWTTDAGNTSIKYLQQFSGNNADLNFRNDKVVDEMAGVFSFWKAKGVDAFVLPAVSYLVEDLTKLNDAAATKNQPENVEVVKKIVKRNPEDPPTLVEVSNLNEADTGAFIANGFVPLSAETDLSSQIDQYTTSSEKFKLFKNAQKGHRVIRLSGPKGRLQGQNQESADVLRLLAYSSNASVLLRYGDEVDGFDTKSNAINWETALTNGSTFNFLKKLTEMQQKFEDDPEKEKFKNYEDNNNKFVFGFVRSEKYATLVNDGAAPATVNFAAVELFNKENAKADVLLGTRNFETHEGVVLENEVTLPARSGVVLKLVES